MIQQSRTSTLKPSLPGVPPTVAPITTPVLIDEMDNRIWCTYGYMPNCAYLIGKRNGEAWIIARENWQSADPKTDLWPNMEKAIDNFLFPAP